MGVGDTLAFGWVGNIETLNASSFGVVETLKTRNSIPIAVFPDAVNRAIGFGFQMPNHYDGGKAVATIGWMAATATTGDVDWILRIARIEDDADDLDSPTYRSVDIIGTAAGGAGRVAYSTKELITGIIGDRIAAGEYYRVIVQRAGLAGGDTMTDDAQFVFFAMREV